MKPKLTILALLGAFAMASTANANIILGWHDFNSIGNIQIPDEPVGANSALAIYSKTGIASNNGGSNSGTYGSSGVDVAKLPNHNDGYAVHAGSAITNTFITIFPAFAAFNPNPFTYLYFDAVVVEAASAALTVTWGYEDGGDLFVLGSQIVNITTMSDGDDGSTETYQEFVINLGSVPLPVGSQTLNFAFSSLQTLRLDNLGFTAIPEPTNVMALALLLTSGVMFRNRRRKA